MRIILGVVGLIEITQQMSYMCIELTEMACCGEKKRWSLLLEAATYIKLYGQQQSGKSWCVPGRQQMRVTVMNEETFIGHLQRKIFKVCSMFLRRGGSIRWKFHPLYSTVTESRRYSSQIVLL